VLVNSLACLDCPRSSIIIITMVEGLRDRLGPHSGSHRIANGKRDAPREQGKTSLTKEVIGIPESQRQPLSIRSAVTPAH